MQTPSQGGGNSNKKEAKALADKFVVLTNTISQVLHAHTLAAGIACAP